MCARVRQGWALYSVFGCPIVADRGMKAPVTLTERAPEWYRILVHWSSLSDRGKLDAVPSYVTRSVGAIPSRWGTIDRLV
jgi:hypothetical protein